MSKAPKTRLQTDEEFIGFDLGHGETALGRAYGATVREPEILEYRGQRSFVTAVAKDGKDVDAHGNDANADEKERDRVE